MTVPDISSARRRRVGGEGTARNHARKRAVRAVNVNDDGAPWSLAPEPRHVWDMRERETVERLRVATDGVWRAYVNSAEHRRAEEHQRCTSDPECAEAMTRIEERVAKEATR